MKTKQIPTPEIDKMRAVKERSQAIGEFIEWLEIEGIEFATRHKHSKACRNGIGLFECGSSNGALEAFCGGGTEKFLARYFGIDLAKVDDEKRALLDQLCAAHEA